MHTLLEKFDASLGGDVEQLVERLATPLSVAKWEALVRVQSHNLTLVALKRWLRYVTGRRWRRGQVEILSDYNRQWRKKKWNKYTVNTGADGAPWFWRDRRVLLTNEAGAAVRLLYINSAISELAPSSVLEVGCGNGINLLLLAACHPEVQFAGIEPTDEGVSAALEVVRGRRLPDALKDFSPLPVIEGEAASRVDFKKGSAERLPYADKAFEVVLTSLALEQMEAIREIALREVVRVSNKYVVMLEPFREVNAAGIRRRYVKTNDYFEGAIADLPDYGLEPVAVVSDMPHKAWLGTALVIAKKI